MMSMLHLQDGQLWTNWKEPSMKRARRPSTQKLMMLARLKRIFFST